MVFLLYLIILFIFIFAFTNKEKARYFSYLYFFIGIGLIFYAAFRDGNRVADYEEYIRFYENYTEVLVEPTFIFISYIIHHSFDQVILVFLIYAILGVTLKLIAIQQLSKLVFLSLLIYISYFFLLHELTQIRVGVASALLLLCIKPLYDRNLKKFLLFVLLATLFHLSAIIILFFWFLNPFKINRIFYSTLIPIAYCACFANINILHFIYIPFFQDKLLYYIQTIDNQEINILNFLYLTRCMLFYYLIYYVHFLSLHNKYAILLVKLYAISLFCFLFFSFVPIIAFRISELIGVVEIILLPLIYYTLRPKCLSKLIVGFFVLLLSSIYIFHVQLISLQ